MSAATGPQGQNVAMAGLAKNRSLPANCRGREASRLHSFTAHEGLVTLTHAKWMLLALGPGCSRLSGVFLLGDGNLFLTHLRPGEKCHALYRACIHMGVAYLLGVLCFYFLVSVAAGELPDK